ncbi:PREDICTED: uncharacterized protein LOC104769865 [Camelina sativa]|uniref:Uncharacterized protein LOC104769865 n=1 Tax=Camelina sativa TaxID=90675 RepID=A0ABM0XXN7_CAMSA|nr:PREDICTED: uncharacterized protein LOC104769865 [Camelina sativa]
MAGDDDPKPSALPKDNADKEDPFINDPLDEFRGFTEEDIQNVMADFNPTLMDISFTENMPPPSMSTLPLPTDVDQTQLMHELDLSITDYNINDEFDGMSSFVDDDYSISWDMFDPSNDDPNGNINNDVVPQEIRNDNVGETTRLEVSTRVFGDVNGPNFETGGPSTMPPPISSDRMFVVSDPNYVCPCCTMLREIVHVKEREISNTLIIFGGIGFLCHALLLTQLLPSDPMEPLPQPQPQPLRYHLNDLTMEEVKKFIEDYCSQREASGLSLMQDTNAAFYQAMSVNSIFNQWPEPLLTLPTCPEVPLPLVSPDEALDVRPAVPLRIGPREQATTNVRKERKNRKPMKEKTPLAAQRARTKKMTVRDFRMHFHLPIETAADDLDVCPTVIKKICREGGLKRWPYRKIKSCQTRIELLKKSLCKAKDGEAKARIEAEIERLQRDIERICSDALRNAK